MPENQYKCRSDFQLKEAAHALNPQDFLQSEPFALTAEIIPKEISCLIKY